MHHRHYHGAYLQHVSIYSAPSIAVSNSSSTHLPFDGGVAFDAAPLMRKPETNLGDFTRTWVPAGSRCPYIIESIAVYLNRVERRACVGHASLAPRTGNAFDSPAGISAATPPNNHHRGSTAARAVALSMASCCRIA